MSSIAFISDVHGNYPALSAVLQDIENRGIKRIICLGDLVGYYPMINEVVNGIRTRGIECVIGNHDYAMLHNDGVIERSKTCTMILQKQLLYISGENLSFLSSLPEQIAFEEEGKSFFCVHGGLNDFVDEYLFEANELYFSKNGFTKDFLVTGHTHKLINLKAGRFTHLNPGSVGQPRDNDPRSSYLIINGDHAEHIRVAYDIDATVRKMEELGYDRYIYEGLYNGKKIG